MGYVFDGKDARAYEGCLNKPAEAAAVRLEAEFMVKMLRPMPGRRLLDIGCGSGPFLHRFLDKGLLVSGLDPSEPMLALAAERFGEAVDLYQGFAEDLPFDDNAFDYAILVKTLEFCQDPQQALSEACRVAKDRLFIGTLNPYSLKTTQLQFKKLFGRSLYRHARFFSIWELKQMVKSVMGDVPMQWRTFSPLSSGRGRIARKVECSGLVQRSPFGTLSGLVVSLVPRFRTRPLELKCPSKGAGAMIVGGCLIQNVNPKPLKELDNHASLFIRIFGGKQGPMPALQPPLSDQGWQTGDLRCAGKPERCLAEPGVRQADLGKRRPD